MTAQPAYQAIYIYRGDPWSMTLSSALDGTPEPVVAADALAQIRASADATTVTAAMSVAVSGTVVTLALSPSATAALAAGGYVWDFQPSPTSETWVRGQVTVVGDVSRAT